MIEPQAVLKALPEDQHAKYQDLFDEYRTEVRDRVYCPKKDCGVFISTYKIKKQQHIVNSMEHSHTMSELASVSEKHKRHDSAGPTPNIYKVDCHKCNTNICLTCKKAAHDGTPCTMEDDAIIATIVKFGYKRCPRCGFGTRRMWGCNHMQCVCGAHWCWNCQRNFSVCDNLGGCEEEEEEDTDPSDDGEDEDEIIEDSQALRAEANSDDDSKMTDVEDGQEQAGNSVAGASTLPLMEEAVQPRRNVNLDRGSHAYWESEGLDFGDEPDGQDNEESWGCTVSATRFAL
jgi:hypothetical protein